jgi:hypothetical protein
LKILKTTFLSISIRKNAIIGEKSIIDSMELLNKLDLLSKLRIGESTGSVAA